MIEIKTLTFKNFLSFGNSVTMVNFEQPGTTLILGEDLDNTTNGQGGNGCGKTAILNALVYGLYDEPISKISKDKLINNINNKDMVITVEFINNDGNHYRVERMRKTKAGAEGNKVLFYENGVDKTRDSKETNKLIIKAIGMPYELFVRIVVFSATHIPFLDLDVSSASGPNQTDIIEELFGLTQLSLKADLLKEFIKNTEGSLKIHQAKIDVLQDEHTRHETQIINARKRVDVWNNQNKLAIDTFMSKLAKIGNVDIDQQKKLQIELDEFDKQLCDQKRFQQQCQQDITSILERYTKVERDLIHLRDNKCPYCLQQFTNTHDKISELEVEKESLYTLLETTNERLKTIKNTIIDISSLYDNVKRNITITNIEELLSIKNQSENIKLKIQELENATNPLDEPLQELLNTKLEPIGYDDVNKLTKDVEHQKFLLKLLTKKDSFIRKTLLNKNIPYLNQQLQHYLETLGLPHTVEFTHQMTAKISRFGRELDFGNLSNGQRARVNIALSFAFRDVLERLHTKVNICMLDEVLDSGLDSIGVQAAARLMKQKARNEGISMYIISHRDEIDNIFDHKMIVQMNKGFSYLVDHINNKNVEISNEIQRTI